MSALIGIVCNRRDMRVTDAELDELCATYESLRGPFPHTTMAAGGFARVRRLGSAPHERAVAATAPSWTLYTGTVHAPNAGGATELQDADGQFAWCAYDAPRDELVLASDPFGMQALYIAERNDKTYFATSALALAKHLRARPSALGLEVFLRAGYQFGARTIWEGIERLDPATRIVFGGQGTRRDTYWRPSVDEDITRLDLAETVDRCRTVARETFRSYYSRAESRPWADLTGGYDSRISTLLLSDAGVDFVTNTIGSAESEDVAIASEVARTAGWDWRRFDIPATWSELLPRLVRDAAAWGDCHLDAVQLAEVMWGHAEKARTNCALLSGGGGEHLRNYAWQQEFLRGGHSTVVNLDNWVDMLMLKPISTAAFANDPTPTVREDLRQRVATAAAPYSSHLNTVQLDMMYAYKSTGHFGAYLSAARATVAVELPYYLKRVFSVAFSTSFRHRNAHRLMQHLIVALDPRLAAITTTKGGPAEPLRVGNIHRFVPYFARISRKAVTKLSEKAISRPLLLPAPRLDATRSRARRALVDTFDDGRPLRADTMRCARLFKRDALEGLLSRAGDADFSDSALLGRILTAELALRMVDAGLDG